jgi:hypothetical protein
MFFSIFPFYVDHIKAMNLAKEVTWLHTLYILKSQLHTNVATFTILQQPMPQGNASMCTYGPA